MEVIIANSIDQFKPHEWDALNEEKNPFVSWNFFKALEVGNCVGKHSGWIPQYFGVIKNQELTAALPLYVKTDSYGEFIFDWQWAQAYARYGLPYYPKLTSAIPYSPISAPKLLGSLEDHRLFLLPKLREFYQKHDFSGLHFLFTREEEKELLNEIDCQERDSIQYHWHRGRCESFEDFLRSHKKSRRKSIKRERREIQESGLEICTLSGKDISKADIEFFYQCYLTTIDKKWSQAYLSLDFFDYLITNSPDSVSLFLVKREDKPIASALYLHSKTTLFGRYWGAMEEVNFLHFELCIYRGIELCLEKGLKIFEAGAQGEHKRMRGFKPIFTKSFHHLKHPDFFKAVTDFLKEESLALRDAFAKEF